MWCFDGRGLVVHRIRDHKEKDTFEALVGNYEGTIDARSRCVTTAQREK